MKKNIKTLYLDGSSLYFDMLPEILLSQTLAIAPGAKVQIQKSRDLIVDLAKSDKPLYGINTGFGYFANKKIDEKQLLLLQENIIKSHASGWGDPLNIDETKLAMVLRLNVLVKGFTGVRYELCQALLNLINHQIFPLIPEYGSVGASGDLAPLAHLALPLIGLGNVHHKGKVKSAKEALKAEGLEPITLAEKEGLGLINGTQIMLAVGGIALFRAIALVKKSNCVAALSYEAVGASLQPLNSLIHQARGQTGQIAAAAEIIAHLKGSFLFDKDTLRSRVQDPYSIRCAPQVHGASMDALEYAKMIVERELNAATDNPLVFADEGRVVSGGNFHGQPLAMAFDFAAIALSEIANIADRRIELMLNPHISGLPAFLSPHEGIDSGYMAAQYLSCSLVNENKILANPACTDSIPGNVGIEDHVSMGMTSARKLARILKNSAAVLAIESVIAAQAIDLQKMNKLGKGSKRLYSAIREKVPALTEDRIIADDIEKAVAVLESFC